MVEALYTEYDMVTDGAAVRARATAAWKVPTESLRYSSVYIREAHTPDVEEVP